MTKKELLKFIKGEFKGKFSRDCRLDDIKQAAAMISKKEAEHQISENDNSEEFDISLSYIKEQLLKRDAVVFLAMVLTVFCVVTVQYFASKEQDHNTNKVIKLFEETNKQKPKRVAPGKIHYRKEKPKMREWK